MYLSVVLAGLIASAAAQTYSECNPMKDSSCSSNDGLSSSTYSVDFTKGNDDDAWKSVGSGDIEYTSSGAEFTINKKGNAPTIQSNWYIFFGRVEVHLKAAPGTGVISSAVLLSDALDEVDWEWLGGSSDEVQTNYYGKGNDESDTRSATFPIADNQATSHNYTIYWTKESCVWYINSKAVRTLKFNDALGGENYPQTPMRVKLGIWAGGDPDNAEGTIEWAGGETDYSGVPYTMTIESVHIENFNPAESYSYKDQTGSYDSIEFDKSDDDESDDDADSSTTASTTSTTLTEASTGTSSFQMSSSTTTADLQNNNAVGTASSEIAAASSATTSSATASAGTEQSSAVSNGPSMWLALGILSTFMTMSI